MIKYFRRIFWQFLKGFSQIALVFVVPRIIGPENEKRVYIHVNDAARLAYEVMDIKFKNHGISKDFNSRAF